ncbi:CYTH domain-containing protein [Oribacterium sp. WCC10]|uniref:CYTH domain-containing protein n=1 Tax=Oribacterium sp. WCC10 TaxID=1855343 RepID=UPI0008EF568A|nr:CYTH domain-containing protein [Oribacterium sp. WCC10]SFG57018.1 CYTH domain-containing protein [Oribacterium sp. WCC10]
MGVEIERKFLVRELPHDLSVYPVRLLEQAYLNFTPTVRIRHDQSAALDKYELTYKGKGDFSHEEYNLPLDKDSYEHLLEKHDGTIIRKKRYMIPVGKYTAELDIFEGALDGYRLVEVEFDSVEEEMAFIPPPWFGDDVTAGGEYSNARLARGILPVQKSLR